MIQHILVPVDGSESSKKALEFACELAQKFNASLSFVHVVEPLLADQAMVMGTPYMTFPVTIEETRKTGESVINAALDIAAAKGCEVSQHELLSGSIAKAILDYAGSNKVDTIVIGSRGLGNVAGLLLGSVSHKVSHLAECTCITVR